MIINTTDNRINRPLAERIINRDGCPMMRNIIVTHPHSYHADSDTQSETYSVDGMVLEIRTIGHETSLYANGERVTDANLAQDAIEALRNSKNQSESDIAAELRLYTK